MLRIALTAASLPRRLTIEIVGETEEGKAEMCRLGGEGGAIAFRGKRLKFIGRSREAPEDGEPIGGRIGLDDHRDGLQKLLTGGVEIVDGRMLCHPGKRIEPERIDRDVHVFLERPLRDFKTHAVELDDPPFGANLTLAVADLLQTFISPFSELFEQRAPVQCKGSDGESERKAERLPIETKVLHGHHLSQSKERSLVNAQVGK